MRSRIHLASLLALTSLSVVGICAQVDGSGDGTTFAASTERTGEELFKSRFAGANGRSCATCHVPEDNFTLKPEHVARLLESDPGNPLFAAIDADDPNAKPLTFEHLKKGLVRVWLTLPDNMDLLDRSGSVVTPPDRKLFVWRAVPSIADSVLTAPYQLDGRMKSLEDQAQGAVVAHIQGGTVSRSELARIAAFERNQFSSERARGIAGRLASGKTPEGTASVEDLPNLTPAEARGQVLYGLVCGKCHGGVNQATITDRELLKLPEDNDFVNIGTAMEMYLAKIGATEHNSFTKDLSFPSYRYRFYRDGSRQEVVVDLPREFGGFGGAGPGFGPSGDDDDGPGFGGPRGFGGGPGFGDGSPNGLSEFPQLFSTDPGRAAITGSPDDFEAFDIPTLRGIAGTAPYFHNNTVTTLEEVVELYSDHLLSRFPVLTQPGEKEVDLDGDIGPEETLTAGQKKDLVAFLKRL